MGHEARCATRLPRAYDPIAHQSAGHVTMRCHTRLATLTDHFTLINSMSHPGSISNHFDATMHNLLSGQSEKRVQEGVPNDQPYLGAFVAKHKPSRRNFVSKRRLIKCVGAPVFCAPNVGIGGYLGSATHRFLSVQRITTRRCPRSRRRNSTTRTTPRDSMIGSIFSADWSPQLR